MRVVGLVENGKYKNLAEDQQPAMFLPLLQSPLVGHGWWCARAAIRSNLPLP